MKTLLISNKYTGISKSLIEMAVGRSLKTIFLEENSRECLLKEIENADYLLASGRLEIDGEVLDRATKLKMIQRTGTGVDSLDLEAIKKRGIHLYVNSGLNSESVAEHTLLLMLGCLRRITEIDHNTRTGMWDKQNQGIKTRELYGKTVGLIGFGNIGKKVANMLIPFRTKTLYFSRKRSDAETEERYNVTFSDLDSLLKNSDIISIHCPLTDTTNGLIDEYAFDLMKDGVIIINTSRGAIISQDSLINALRQNKISYAGIDVYEKEPIVADNPIMEFGNVIMSPHIAGITKESFERMITDAIRNIKYFDEGEYEKICDYRII
ncbi:MAG: 2-hydroxyacid dehydrogenase [Lachnospiraceae bacterium]|nr:2-hydroxyacid dehydrogenase [Lachnospiraceae bacterium]